MGKIDGTGMLDLWYRYSKMFGEKKYCPSFRLIEGEINLKEFAAGEKIQGWEFAHLLISLKSNE